MEKSVFIILNPKVYYRDVQLFVEEAEKIATEVYSDPFDRSRKGE
jgi:hypothetical protein